MKTSLRITCARSLPASLVIVAAVSVPWDAVAASTHGSRVRQPVARSLMHGFAAIPLAADELRPVERAFLASAIETSRYQMRLAEIGASNADSSDVRSHALELMNDYRLISDALDALLRRKGGIAGAPTGRSTENYQALMEKSGADFDREFVRASAKVSDEVMALFEQAAADAKDSDIRELAAAQLPRLRGHRSRITDLKRVHE